MYHNNITVSVESFPGKGGYFTIRTIFRRVMRVSEMHLIVCIVLFVLYFALHSYSPVKSVRVLGAVGDFAAS